MELLSLKKKGLSTDGIQPFLFVFTYRFYSRACIFFSSEMSSEKRDTDVQK